ncbi:MAG TPA: hypothetical protein VF199_04600 [Bacillales bacterium]
MMIAIWSPKGGTGVSSVAWGLAKAMKEQIHLIDFDLLTPALAAMAGLEDTHHGLDRVLLHADQLFIKNALKENWVNINDVRLLPGVKYPPGHEETLTAEATIKALLEPIQSETVLVDAGTGLCHPLQREILLRADVIIVVVTPYLLSYHRLWTMWQNDFFIPYGQMRKTGVLVNQFHGSVAPKDIATLMDIWLAGDLPTVKQMEDAVNQGHLHAAYPRPFLKCLRKIGEGILERTEQINSSVKMTQESRVKRGGERREWQYETRP